MIKKEMKLYFIDGTVPTDKERAAAAALGITAFRNSKLTAMVSANVTAVAGAVPACYAKSGVKVLTIAAPAPAATAGKKA